MLTLHGMSSPNVRKVGILLEELGLVYDLNYVDVFRAGQFDPAFRALNPLGKVPVLVDTPDDEGAAGEALFESGAILITLAERHGQLLPASGAERAEVIQWVMVQMANIGPMLGQLNHFQLLGDAQPYGLARYREAAAKLYRLLDDRLADRDWLAGSAYSIADIAAYPWAGYLEQHGFDPAAHPHLIRWRDTIAARPAVATTKERFAATFTSLSRTSRQSATPAELDLFFGRPEHAPAADYSAVAR